MRVGTLGCGGFGQVTLEQHVGTRKSYALKTLSKGISTYTTLKII